MTVCFVPLDVRFEPDTHHNIQTVLLPSIRKGLEQLARLCSATAHTPDMSVSRVSKQYPNTDFSFCQTIYKVIQTIYKVI